MTMPDAPSAETLVEKWNNPAWGFGKMAAFRADLDAFAARARAEAIEECRQIAENYGREAERTSKEYACEVADEIASRIGARQNPSPPD